MKLKEAIGRVGGMLKDGGVSTAIPSVELEAVEIVLAAARAYACETCLGTGKKYTWCSIRTCPDCKADREKLKGNL